MGGSGRFLLPRLSQQRQGKGAQQPMLPPLAIPQPLQQRPVGQPVEHLVSVVGGALPHGRRQVGAKRRFGGKGGQDAEAAAAFIIAQVVIAKGKDSYYVVARVIFAQVQLCHVATPHGGY